jgi:hypothetical protein
MLSHTRTQNDKNMFKHGVCIIMFVFVFRFCYSTTSLAVPFTTVKMSGALTNFYPLSFESEPLNKKVSHFFPAWFIPIEITFFPFFAHPCVHPRNINHNS